MSASQGGPRRMKVQRENTNSIESPCFTCANSLLVTPLLIPCFVPCESLRWLWKQLETTTLLGFSSRSAGNSSLINSLFLDLHSTDRLARGQRKDPRLLRLSSLKFG